MQVQPYLFFDGRCEEALTFYSQALGAQVTALMRYRESPEPPPPGNALAGDKIMHANLQIGATQIMASDGQRPGEGLFKGFSLSITAATDAQARRLFDALADGGHIQMPFGPTFFATAFGMVADRFGVGWMVIVPR
ncbi:MAG: VOC family protein [Burkholderiaceae bacterium]|nr:VOC family protein [Burkholderiaceae bacterium]